MTTKQRHMTSLQFSITSTCLSVDSLHRTFFSRFSARTPPVVSIYFHQHHQGLDRMTVEGGPDIIYYVEYCEDTNNLNKFPWYEGLNESRN